MSSHPSPLKIVQYIPDDISDDSDDEKSTIDRLKALDKPGTKAGKKGSSKTSSKPQGTSGKRKRDVLSDGSDDEDIQVTAYVHIAKPAPLPAGPGKSKKVPAPVTVIRGPFMFKLDCASFVEFKQELAGAVECRVKNLPKNIFWTFDKPANDSQKPLLSLKGFEAMVAALEAAAKKAPNLVIKVHMPPPSIDDVSWETPTGEHVPRPYNHDNELAGMVPEFRDTSAKAQIAAMQEGSAGFLAKLHNHHTVDNHSDFPNVRILERTIGNNKYCWELTALRLQVWANSLARSEAGVTLDIPPNSVHFDISKALKKAKPAVPPVPDSGLPVSNAPPAYPYPFPPFGGFPYPFVVPPMPYGGNPYAMLPTQMPGVLPGSQYPVSPTPARNLPKLSLEAFCARYEVSDATFAKLQTLEYEPGDSGVEKMPQTEWEKVGFTWLGWHQFLKVHRLFVKEGTT